MREELSDVLDIRPRLRISPRATPLLYAKLMSLTSAEQQDYIRSLICIMGDRLELQSLNEGLASTTSQAAVMLPKKHGEPWQTSRIAQTATSLNMHASAEGVNGKDANAEIVISSSTPSVPEADPYADGLNGLISTEILLEMIADPPMRGQ